MEVASVALYSGRRAGGKAGASGKRQGSVWIAALTAAESFNGKEASDVTAPGGGVLGGVWTEN